MKRGLATVRALLAIIGIVPSVLRHADGQL